MSAIEVIRAIFVEDMEDVADLIEIPADRWFAEAPEDPTRMHRPFGFLPPTPIDDDDPRDDSYEVLYSPELIARQVGTRSDPEVEEYAGALSWHCHQHVIHFHEGYTADELERHIDNTLYGMAPRTARNVSEVQANALTSCS